MDQRPLTAEQVVHVFTEAVNRTDLALWERIKKGDERKRWLAALDAFELARDELQIQLDGLMNEN